MLGERLSDTAGVDGTAGHVRGLGLLPVETVFTPVKHTVPIVGRTVVETFLGLPGEGAVEGYELHLGETRRHGCRPFAELTRAPSGERVLDGAVSADGLVVGTYVHGLFGHERLRSALFATLARRTGRPYAAGSLPDDRFATLSSWFRSNVDVTALTPWVR